MTTLVTATSASAATADTDNCNKLVGNGMTLTGTLSGCPAAETGGSGKLSNFRPTGGHIMWHNGTTTDFKTKASRTEGDRDGTYVCPAGSSEFELKGKVSASTNSSMVKGAAVTMEVCSNPTSNALTNEPHTTVNFGS